MSRQTARTILGVAGLILADQASKAIFPTLFLNSRLNQVTFIAAIVVLVVAFYNLSATTADPPSIWRARYSLLTITAGGVSNLLDRLWWGGVRDTYSLGALYFNIADLYVVAGVGILLYSLHDH